MYILSYIDSPSPIKMRLRLPSNQKWKYVLSPSLIQQKPKSTTQPFLESFIQNKKIRNASIDLKKSNISLTTVQNSKAEVLDSLYLAKKLGKGVR